MKKKEETTEELLQQLRDSQGPGDAFMEVTPGGIKTTAGSPFNKRNANVKEDEELTEEIFQILKAQIDLELRNIDNKSFEMSYMRAMNKANKYALELEKELYKKETDM